MFCGDVQYNAVVLTEYVTTIIFDIDCDIRKDYLDNMLPCGTPRVIFGCFDLAFQNSTFDKFGGLKIYRLDIFQLYHIREFYLVVAGFRWFSKIYSNISH